MVLRPAVFLDRDDTILDTTAVTAGGTVPTGDLYDPALVRLLPGVPEALRLLRDRGFVMVVYTSQGGVARGSGTLADLEAVNDRMRTLVGEGMIAAVYACPFHPKGTVARFMSEHPWRKPQGGMIVAAAGELGLDLARSWAVGDKPRDAEAATAGGIAPERAIVIRTSGEAGRCSDLLEAARVIVGASGAEVPMRRG